MKKRILLTIAGLILVGLFFVFTFVVRSDALRPFDFNMTVKIQDHMPERAYKYLTILSELASVEVISVLIFLLLAVWRQWWQMILVFGTYAGAHVLELVGKLILSQPPPPFMFYKLQSMFWFPANYVAEGKNSYPSGHSLRAFFFAVLVSSFIVSSKKVPFALKVMIPMSMFVLAGLVALAKVALGQHWTTDVIAGCFLGLGSALFLTSFFNYSFKKKSLLK